MQTLGMFARLPIPGQTKTRLAASIGEAAAARLATAFLTDLAGMMREFKGDRVIAYTPAEPAAESWFLQLAGEQITVWPQSAKAGGLGDRMGDFFREYLKSGDSRVVLIGSDSPTLPACLINDAFQLLEQRDCVLGPAVDGGFYLIGLRGSVRMHLSEDSTPSAVGNVATNETVPRMTPRLFDKITWGSRFVLRETVERIEELGLSLGLLAPWYDVDTWEDLQWLTSHLAALSVAGESATTATIHELRTLRTLL